MVRPPLTCSTQDPKRHPDSSLSLARISSLVGSPFSSTFRIPPGVRLLHPPAQSPPGSSHHRLWMTAVPWPPYRSPHCHFANPTSSCSDLETKIRSWNATSTPSLHKILHWVFLLPLNNIQASYLYPKALTERAPSGA